MAMLAGPRQRKRYNLVPKGKALFEDGDRFGTKMLEKMGWSKGKGLGSKENGQQEFIRIRYKNDANGLGYEDRDDQWTEHEKHFNGLLESLHAGESNSNTASGDEGDNAAPRVGFGFEKSKTNKDKLKDKFSGQSLEERSKKSKARVHYKKFTKGKDMAQYSEKDLANIFGKKATADDNDFYSQLPSFNAGNEATDDGDKKQEFELGTHTVNTGLSVADYFKMKMEALKNKKTVVEKNEDAERIGDGQEDIVEVIDIANESDNESNRKKKKKSKKQKLEDVSEKESGFGEDREGADLNTQQVEVCENGEEEPVVLKSKKKKSKKAPLCDTQSDCVEVIILDDESSEEPHPKKKKSKKNATETDSEQVFTESAADVIPQKRKKNKKRKAEESLESLASVTNDQLDNPSKKKKTEGSPEDEPGSKIPKPESSENPGEKEKKKLESSEKTPIDSSVLTESSSKRSKKKNRKKTDSTGDAVKKNSAT